MSIASARHRHAAHTSRRSARIFRLLLAREKIDISSMIFELLYASATPYYNAFFMAMPFSRRIGRRFRALYGDSFLRRGRMI